jgi:Fe-S-cluster-containing dehydrogenase component/formate-dependent nitrite reductase membrane component NrfD
MHVAEVGVQARPRASTTKWAKLIDQTRCIGCHACTTACKSENEVPLSVTRTYVKYVDVGRFPQTRRAYQVTRCNQCEAAPCVAACPTGAMFKRADGIVDFDKSICIGCKACMAACPYDAIFINPEDHSAEKCNFCAHRIDRGLEPACVVVCPTEALLVGDLYDPTSKVAQMVQREAVTVRKPEKETKPLVFYKGAHAATLDPLAARRPEGGLFLWSQQRTGPQLVVSGHPGRPNNSAAAVLAYDSAHTMPWDWRVSLYTWTKSIAAGVYLMAAMLLLAGRLDPGGTLWTWGVPFVAGGFLALTGALLIGDLEHPERFYLIFTHPQWRSWLVRGALVITAYAIVLAIHVIASAAGAGGLSRPLVFAGIPLAAFTAIYTAYLFAQAKARDLWQSSVLPVHLFVQALMAGSAVLLVCAIAFGETAAVAPLIWSLVGTGLAHLLIVGGEITLPHVTAHAKLATHEMTSGRFRGYFRAGVSLIAAGVLLASWFGMAAAVLVLVGLVAHEHAYVQAGQSVPLA